MIPLNTREFKFRGFSDIVFVFFKCMEIVIFIVTLLKQIHLMAKNP